MKRTLLTLALLSPLAAANSADYVACKQALAGAEQASRIAQEALLVAGAKGAAPAFEGAINELVANTLEARETCKGGEAASEESSSLSDFLPDFESSDDEETSSTLKRRTPAERVHGRY